MKILFINTNQIVQKLVEVTAQKANVELKTVSEPSQIGDMDQYDYIIVDDGCYNMDKAAYDALISGRRACLIYSKHEEMSEGFSEYIKKPFIPTHILEIMVAQIANVQNKEAFFQTPESTESSSSSDENPQDQSDENLSPLAHLKALSEEYNLTDEENSIDDTADAQSLPTEIDKEDILGDLKLEDELGDLDTRESSDVDLDSLDSITSESRQVSEDTPQETEQADETQELDLESLNLGDLGDMEAESTEGLLDQDESFESLQELSELTQQVEQAQEQSEEFEGAEEVTKSEAVSAPQVLDSEQISEVSHILDELQDLPETEEELKESDGDQDIDLMGDINLDELGDLSDLSDVGDERSTQEGGFDDSNSDDTNSIDNIIGEIAESNDVIGDSDQDDIQSKQEDMAKDLDLGMQDLDLESLDLGDLQSQDLEPLESVQENLEASDVSLDDIADLEASTHLDEIQNEIKEEIQDENQSEIKEEEIKQDKSAEIGSDEGAQDDEAQDTQDMIQSLESNEIQNINPESDLDTQSTQSIESTESSQDTSQDQLLEEMSGNPEERSPESPDEDLGDSQVQIQEVQLGEDFQALDEQEVLRAVGEEAVSLQSPQDILEDQSTAIDTADAAQGGDTNQTNRDIEIVTNALSQSIQDSIKHLQSSELTALLDGMEVTINISFKDTHK